ncbi:hypothetical protein [Nitriliruptor alkaliphilus]|uniref:hypothetical protein n=1 Tax=Nitriliruptor alkaliphilus TaxID=427918 RepID=UPI00069850B7|nr:hypothetical protein [Nitriliruptor alkaliphilus]
MSEQAPDPGSPPVTTLTELESVLDGAALLGLELDTRYRVLAATLEPTPDRYPWRSGVGGVEVVDRRVQVLVAPVSTILGSLRRRVPTDEGGRTEVYTFSDEQLVDVVSAFDGAPVATPLFGQPEPRPGTWAPEWSLEGRSTAGDGVTHTFTVSVRHDDDAGELALDLFVRFDEVHVKDPFGTELFASAPPDPLDLGTG